MPRLQTGTPLSEQLAETLASFIQAGTLAAGDKLPTEGALVTQFGVSRTVVREAFSRLKTLGLIETRQGSGAYVKALPAPEHQKLNLTPDGTLDAVLQMVEVRRALEAESAALAASRATEQDKLAIEGAMQALDEAVARGGDGVAEDVAFHAAIARAANNPFLLATLSYLNQFLEHATRVTRANEATKANLGDEVRREHHAIAQAIMVGNVKAARAAGTRHMVNAAKRIGQADPVFWALHGRELAQRLKENLSVGHAPNLPPGNKPHA